MFLLWGKLLNHKSEHKITFCCALHWLDYTSCYYQTLQVLPVLFGKLRYGYTENPSFSHVLSAKQDSRPGHTMLKIYMVPALLKLVFAKTYSTDIIHNKRVEPGLNPILPTSRKNYFTSEPKYFIN